MAIKQLESYNNLHGISQNTDNKTIDVEVGFVFWDCDVKCICDAIEYLATIGKGNKSITIQSFNLDGITIKAGESPVDVYKRIQAKYKWYSDPMPKEIADAQAKFEDRLKKESNESQSDSEPGERE